MHRRNTVVIAGFAGLAVTLAACGGAGSSSSVVHKRSPIAVAAGTHTPAGTSSSGTGSGSGAVPSGPVTPPGVVDTQSLDQIGSQLGTLDHSVTVASSDLTNPQGDS
jgi:hypothetical protein